MPKAFNFRLSFVLPYILGKKITNPHQIDEVVSFLKRSGNDPIDKKKFEEEVGLNVHYSLDDYKANVLKVIEKNRENIIRSGKNFVPASLIPQVKKHLKFSDGSIIKSILEEEIKKLNLEEKNPSPIPPECNGQNKETIHEIENDVMFKLIARDLASSLNDKKTMQKHLQMTSGKVLTRFPPEPNGYLHIGHAKAMRFNFTFAEKHNGDCYLRYDDTDPEKESHEFIDNIRENVNWLGYKPWKVTYASDYFDKMYELAEELIKRGKAYICHQSQEEMNACRRDSINSPFRDRSVEENLILFRAMKEGQIEEKKVT